MPTRPWQLCVWIKIDGEYRLQNASTFARAASAYRAYDNYLIWGFPPAHGYVITNRDTSQRYELAPADGPAAQSEPYRA